MNTKLLMTTSAIMMGITGVLLSFFPGELAKYPALVGTNPVILQITGSLYFGFAILNWSAKANLIGGIYSKPVAMGNFTHFFIGGLVLVKLVTKNMNMSYLWIAVIVYSIFAILFGYISFTNPVSGSKK
jgi:hypothetical protein